MLDTISSQYDSFIYWRMPIPRLELAELEGLGLGEGPLYAPRAGLAKLTGPQEPASQGSSAEEDSLLPFNSFNFWRAPIASISSFDFDLI
ncbi:AF1Q protein, partial [Chauna torquata]|nr:AF1Q protein [Chauna torquata]